MNLFLSPLKITLTFLFILVSSFSFAGPKNCGKELLQILEDALEGKSYKMFAPDEKKVLRIDEVFDNPQVFLGIEKGGHFYLMVGGKKVSGGFFPMPTTIKKVQLVYLILHLPVVSSINLLQ